MLWTSAIFLTEAHPPQQPVDLNLHCHAVILGEIDIAATRATIRIKSDYPGTVSVQLPTTQNFHLETFGKGLYVISQGDLPGLGVDKYIFIAPATNGQIARGGQQCNNVIYSP